MSDITESATGAKFPGTITPPGFRTSVQFLAAGVREKKIAFIGVKVYAVAVYVPRGEAAEALVEFKGTPGGKLAKDEKFFKSFQEASLEKCLTMCFVRDITGEQFSNGLRENIEPRLKSRGVGNECLNAFLDAFSGIQLHSGTRIFLSLSPPSSTRVTIVNKTEVPENLEIPEGTKSSLVESSDLLSTLNEVYFGKDCPSGSLKKAVAENFPGLF